MLNLTSSNIQPGSICRRSPFCCHSKPQPTWKF